MNLASAPAFPKLTPLRQTVVSHSSLDAMTAEPADPILIVEDEFFVALALQDVIEAAGFAVLGPYRQLTSAWEVARRQAMSAAFLDIRIDGGTVFPVANALQTRGIPFAFVTANPELITAKAYPQAPVINKPFGPSEVAGTLRKMLN